MTGFRSFWWWTFELWRSLLHLVGFHRICWEDCIWAPDSRDFREFLRKKYPPIWEDYAGWKKREG
ncbi:hypothetical protein LCGC14_1326240 [marine sediment metagenome]|uniref:Uncharacterized protein n=1 Tax=marine sediment metagenome TaxID=412755 RepID=A0A0F9KIP2_9ZZZZ